MKYLTALTLSAVLFSCGSDNMSQSSNREDKSVPVLTGVEFSKEVKEIRSRVLSLPSTKLVLWSDTIALESALNDAPCGKLYVDLLQDDHELLLEHLEVNRHTNLNELVQSYPVVFENQIGDLSGNLFGGSFVVPFFSGQNKFASVFTVKNNRVSSLEVFLPAQ